MASSSTLFVLIFATVTISCTYSIPLYGVRHHPYRYGLGQQIYGISRHPISTIRHIRQPIVSGHIRQPIVSGHIRQPVFAGPIRQPVFAGSYRQPVVKTSIRQPVVGGHISQPVATGSIYPAVVPQSPYMPGGMLGLGFNQELPDALNPTDQFDIDLPYSR